jgi:tripartite-type tricarboxylate transporter receptor subunit TctC
MKLPRRRFLHFAAGAAASRALSRVAMAQAYPTRPVHIIVPFPAGGATDVIARVVAEPMRKSLGQPILVENVGGADGSIGTGRAVRANPDGYTIIIGLMETQVLNGAFYSLPYDVLNDFVAVSPLVTFSNILFARKTMPAADVNELIASLKAHPGNASAGVGSIGLRLSTAFFQKETGTRFTMVPYRGVAPAMQDLLAGQIDLLFAGPEQLPLMLGSSIKAYAVTSDMRIAAAPDIPTFREIGLPTLSYTSWGALFAPKGTPKDAIGRLNAAAVEAAADPAVRSRFKDLGFEIFAREQQTPEVLAALVRGGAEKWWPIIKELGIKAE